MPVRICTKCHVEKPLLDFAIDRKAKLGRSSRCNLCAAAHVRAYCRLNKEIVLERKRKWYDEHPHWKKEYHREYQRRRRAQPIHRILSSLRTRVNHAIKNKGQTTVELLGCSSERFRAHLQSLWQEGMSWETYGRNGWEIDHIIPCAAFDLTDPEQQKKCFHWTNCQPLWKAYNIRKSNFIIERGEQIRVSGSFK